MAGITERRKVLRKLAARLGVKLENVDLWDRALTHASLAGEDPDVEFDYESLEFLGDAVLGLAVAHHLYLEAPDRAPGDYSRMRAMVVNRRALAKVAQTLEIAPAIRLGKGEEDAGGRQRLALLADCLEAMLGAIYLDQGWEAARSFIGRVFHEQLIVARGGKQVWDFKSRLQHYCQAGRIPLPEFRIVRSVGPDHRKEFEVEVLLRQQPAGRGSGRTKKEAEQNAAREALLKEGQLVD